MSLSVGETVYIIPLDRFGKITKVKNLEELEYPGHDWFTAHTCYWVKVRGYTDDERVFGEEDLETVS